MRANKAVGFVAQHRLVSWLGLLFSFLLPGVVPVAVHAAPVVDATVVELGGVTDRVNNYSVVLSSAEKTGRELLVKHELTVSGERVRKLWQWPRDASVTGVFKALSGQLQGSVLFDCEGADCGRSNVWSTLVFGEAQIYGPSQYQYYRVVQEAEGNVHVLYVVRRGNRRVHALYEQISGVGVRAEEKASRGSVVAALAENGSVRLAAVPAVDGSLSAETRNQLERVGAQLAGFGAGEIYAVCHLYRSGLPRSVGESRRERRARGVEVSTAESVEQLLAASSRCGEAVAIALQAGLTTGAVDGVADEPKNRKWPDAIVFKSFGAGPLQPMQGTVNRIELVVPSRLLRE